MKSAHIRFCYVLPHANLHVQNEHTHLYLFCLKGERHAIYKVKHVVKWVNTWRTRTVVVVLVVVVTKFRAKICCHHIQFKRYFLSILFIFPAFTTCTQLFFTPLCLSATAAASELMYKVYTVRIGTFVSPTAPYCDF